MRWDEQLKCGTRLVGLRQSLKALREERLEAVFIAKDADLRITQGFEEECIKQQVKIIFVDTMKELGRACGVEVPTAVASIVKYNI